MECSDDLGLERIGTGLLLANAHQNLENVSDPELKRTLTLLIGDAEELAEGLDQRSKLVSERLEAWFNDRMARAEGWYKRRAQTWSLGLALGVTLFFNADTIHVTQRLWSDGTMREAAVAVAAAYRDAPQGSIEKSEVVQQLLSRSRALQSSVLPVGWQGQEGSQPGSIAGHALRLAGWMITALAVSLGAAFWFDVLSRALHLRDTGAKVSVVTGRVEPRLAEVLS